MHNNTINQTLPSPYLTPFNKPQTFSSFLNPLYIIRYSLYIILATAKILFLDKNHSFLPIFYKNVNPNHIFAIIILYFTFCHKSTRKKQLNLILSKNSAFLKTKQTKCIKNTLFNSIIMKAKPKI